MKTKEELILVQKEFFEVYYFFLKHNLVLDDKISMGNLALFVDYYRNRHRWKEKKGTIKRLAETKDFNELNMFIAKELYECAKNEELSDNLLFKLEKMEKDYFENKLNYFDMILDIYEFPHWFKRVLEYYSPLSKKELYDTFYAPLNRLLNMNDSNNELGLLYFIDKFYGHENQLEVMFQLDTCIQEESINEVAWFLALKIFSVYYPELERTDDKEEQAFVLNKLKNYKQLYEQKELKEYNLFSESKKIK